MTISNNAFNFGNETISFSLQTFDVDFYDKEMLGAMLLQAMTLTT